MPRNIYGVTKVAAEDLCELFHRDHGLPVRGPADVAVLPGGRTTTRRARRLRRREREGERVPLPAGGHADVVDAHLLALERAPAIGFGRYIVSATTPFAARRPGRAAPRRACAWCGGWCRGTRRSTPVAAGGCSPASTACTSTSGRAPTSAGSRATTSAPCSTLRAGEDPRSPLARAVGSKGYHPESTGPYTIR